jgi:hypothetical protein
MTRLRRHSTLVVADDRDHFLGRPLKNFREVAKAGSFGAPKLVATEPIGDCTGSSLDGSAQQLRSRLRQVRMSSKGLRVMLPIATRR